MQNKYLLKIIYYQPIVLVMSSETSLSLDLTVICIVTPPSDKANLAFTRTSTPPLKMPENS